MDTNSNTIIQAQATSTPTNIGVSAATNKIIYSAPASPVAITNSSAIMPTTSARTAVTGNVIMGVDTSHANSIAHGIRMYGNSMSSHPAATPTSSSAANGSNLSTPKKHFLDAVMLQTIREKLRTPGGACELQTLRLECSAEPVNVIKDRYLISTQPQHISVATAAKSPASYRHLIDLTCSNLKCTDVFTEEQFLCKIINEPLHKVQRAYFQLQQEADQSSSSIYGHALIRHVHDIVPLSKHRTYIIISAHKQQQKQQQQHFEQQNTLEERLAATDDCNDGDGIYEDLHTYIRNKRRLCETEARALFHQICQTVQVCHRNGIILRDLKLKRFYFIDAARTKLQYESLEGSMILDDADNDTLSDKIGCPLYTAPELLCPQPTYQGKPADMWSLGVILYTMLVGQYPFYEKGNCNLITIIRHCNVQIPGILSKSVRWLLHALLRKNYQERMQAEHIFFAPWLKEQRPYYMYVPADVLIPDDETDEAREQVAALSLHGCMEPLDYTRSALQMDCDDDNIVDAESVEMG